MILEGIVTTRNADGSTNVAPMGPRLSVTEEGQPDFGRFLLRPFQGSRTFDNLMRDRQGVLHVVDDVLLLARAALGVEEPLPAMRPATTIAGAVLADCCRYFEFVLESIDDSAARAEAEARTVHAESVRDFFGLNRAKHAVLEAAILATRRHLLPAEEITEALGRLETLVEKTAGPAEAEAFALIKQTVAGGER